MMKTLSRILFAVLLCGCNSQALAGCNTPPNASARTVDLRLRGVNAGTMQAALFDVKELAVTGSGGALEVELGDRKIDLATVERPWLLGRFVAPDGSGGDRVHVVVVLDDFGGFAGANAAGFIDARRAPIEFDLPLARLSDRESATVQLDLGRSLVAREPTVRRLLPQLTILY
jgi:hypothetical protein